MYQKYSIGTMAHLMGISAEALRYYESKNIVSPIRDPETGYRYFNTWDFHMLLRWTVSCIRSNGPYDLRFQVLQP